VYLPGTPDVHERDIRVVIWGEMATSWMSGAVPTGRLLLEAGGAVDEGAGVDVERHVKWAGLELLAGNADEC
jgi:hypothetical protein